VKTVHEIDVGMAGLAPHGLGSRGATTSVGVARGVVDPEVGLDLVHAENDDPVGMGADHELAKELARHNLGGARVRTTSLPRSSRATTSVGRW